jgi:hypothetical protein
MAEIIMYDFKKFKTFLEANVPSKDVRDKLMDAGTTFSSDEYSITKLGTGTGRMRSGSPSISLTRKEDGTHILTKSGEPPVDVDGPKVPPKLE